MPLPTFSWKPYLHRGAARAASSKAWVRSSSLRVLGSDKAYSSVMTSPSVVVKHNDSSQPLLLLQRAQMGWPPIAVRGNPGGGRPGNFGTTRSGSTLWSARMNRTLASLRPARIDVVAKLPRLPHEARRLSCDRGDDATLTGSHVDAIFPKLKFGKVRKRTLSQHRGP